MVLVEEPANIVRVLPLPKRVMLSDDMMISRLKTFTEEGTENGIFRNCSIINSGYHLSVVHTPFGSFGSVPIKRSWQRSSVTECRLKELDRGIVVQKE